MDSIINTDIIQADIQKITENFDVNNITQLVNDIVTFLHKNNIKNPQTQEALLDDIGKKVITHYVDNQVEREMFISLYGLACKAVLLQIRKKKCLFCFKF